MDKGLPASGTFLRSGAAPARLCAVVVPKVIENDSEFDRMAEELERLTFRRNATAEEEVLAKSIQRFVEDYDKKHHPLPAVAPSEAVKILMEQRGLRQADLVEAIGSRAQVSDLLSGRRGVSKAQAKRLAGFFRAPIDLFI